MDIGTRNSKIAKNTVALYIRMLFTTIVSLYTSRVVLQALGVEDFGLYGLVGGVVAMLGFINTALSGATSRFITYELGAGNKQRLNKTFISALLIHICIAILLFLIAETIGLWFVNTKLIIPEQRIVAANIVYQCSILTAVINIIQVPYTATIIAHERMGVFAAIEIFNTTLKLLIAYSLMLLSGDQLSLYAIFLLFVAAIVLLTYRTYCSKKFDESRAKIIYDPSIFKPMLSFAGWDLYGNMCVTVRQQGINILLNRFFGLFVNAANSITMMFNGAILGFANNIVMAFRPQIVKTYSNSDWPRFNLLMKNALQFSMLFFIMLSIPCFVEIETILNVWLKEVPDYTAKFCRISLIVNCLSVANTVFGAGIHATGKIKKISLITGTLFLTTLIVAYLLLRCGFDAPSVYIASCVIMLLVIISNLSILKSQIYQVELRQLLVSLLKVAVVSILTFVPIYLCYTLLEQGIIRLLINCCLSAFVTVVLGYIIILSPQQRQNINEMVKDKLRSKLCR